MIESIKAIEIESKATIDSIWKRETKVDKVDIGRFEEQLAKKFMSLKVRCSSIIVDKHVKD